MLEPELPKRRAELDELGIKYSDEDLMSYALFPQVALEFFARRDRKERPKEELAALVAAVAGLLGVDKEVTCAPQPAEAAAATAEGAEQPCAAEARARHARLGRGRPGRTGRRPRRGLEVLT